MAKIHPEENFFIVPAASMPLWKQLELARDPNFKDLHESLQGGPKDTWSAKHGYETTFRQEAAILKENTREANRLEQLNKVQKAVSVEYKTECCTIM